jgi:hypothetical protein
VESRSSERHRLPGCYRSACVDHQRDPPRDDSAWTACHDHEPVRYWTLHQNGIIIDSAITPTGNGYYMLGTNGGNPPNKPITALTPVY